MAVNTNGVETRADRFRARLVHIDLTNGITPGMQTLSSIQKVRSDIRTLESGAAQSQQVADNVALPDSIKRVARFNATLKLGHAARLKRALNGE